MVMKRVKAFLIKHYHLKKIKIYSYENSEKKHSLLYANEIYEERQKKEKKY